MLISKEPFCHFVSDDFLDIKTCEVLSSHFPLYEAIADKGVTYSRVYETGKAELNFIDAFPEPFKDLSLFFSSDETRKRVADLLHIKDELLFDGTFRGAGLHSMRTGGSLSVHTDFTRLSKDSTWYRRANVIVYLTQGWKPKWGGNIELWDKDVSSLAFSSFPSFGRVIGFETISGGFHGVSEIKSPPGINRNSFSVFYYSKSPPPTFQGDHGTIFRSRPNEWKKRYFSAPLELALIKAKRIPGRIERAFCKVSA